MDGPFGTDMLIRKLCIHASATSILSCSFSQSQQWRVLVMAMSAAESRGCCEGLEEMTSGHIGHLPGAVVMRLCLIFHRHRCKGCSPISCVLLSHTPQGTTRSSRPNARSILARVSGDAGDMASTQVSNGMGDVYSRC